MKRTLKALFDLAKRYWAVINRPSAHYSLGFLVVCSFVAGIVF